MSDDVQDDREIRIIGSFGTAITEAEKPDVKLQFEFPIGTGHMFTVATVSGGAPWLKFAAALETNSDIRSLAFLAAMNGLLRDCLATADEYTRFMEVATRYRVGANDIFGVCQGVWEALSGFPTVPASDSANGSAPTGTNSNISPSSPDMPPSGRPGQVKKRRQVQRRRTG